VDHPARRLEGLRRRHGEPLTFAFGAEYRKETYEIKPGDPASRYKEGSQSYPGFALTDAGKHSRKNYAFYADVALSPSEPLKLDFAARYEHFSDFGDTFVAKLTGRYDFSPAIAVRGTASTGFRAPTLAEEYYSATNVSPTSAFVQLPPNSPAAALVGVNGLDPEKSTNFSVGFVSHPGYGITAPRPLPDRHHDRIVGSGSLFGSGGDVNLPGGAGGDPGQRQRAGPHRHPDRHQHLHQRPRHPHPRRRAGADHSSDFGDMGSVQWSLTGNYTHTKVTKIAAPPTQLAGASLFDLTAIDNLETTSPGLPVVGGALWTWAPAGEPQGDPLRTGLAPRQPHRLLAGHRLDLADLLRQQDRGDS
jgi:iron complex outermembrane receptor protein